MTELGKLDSHEAPDGTNLEAKKSSNPNENSIESKFSDKSLMDGNILKNRKNIAPEISKNSVTSAKNTDKATVVSSFSRENYLDRSTVVDTSNNLEISRELEGDRNQSQSENTSKDEKGVVSSSPELYFHGR